jgi:hypothetical protein
MIRASFPALRRSLSGAPARPRVDVGNRYADEAPGARAHCGLSAK